VTSIVQLTERKTPQMIAAVYFLQPTQLTLQRLANDFATAAPYSKVYVFFSSKVSRGQRLPPDERQHHAQRSLRSIAPAQRLAPGSSVCDLLAPPGASQLACCCPRPAALTSTHPSTPPLRSWQTICCPSSRRRPTWCPASRPARSPTWSS
jgi:hypothetical protein